jgi:hypothetical protein
MFLRTEIVNFSMMGIRAWTQLQSKLSETAPGKPIQKIGTPLVTKRIIVWSGRPGGLSSTEPETTALFDYVSEVWGLILTILVAAGSVSWALSLKPEGKGPPVSPLGPGKRADRPSRLELILGGRSLPALPNLSSRETRSALVHVESKVKRWIQTREAAGVDPFEISTWAIGDKSPAPPGAFRYLDLKTWQLTVNGKPCNLKGISDELSILVETLEVQFDTALQ